MIENPAIEVAVELPTDLHACQKALLHERQNNNRLQDTMQKQRGLNEALLQEIQRLQSIIDEDLARLTFRMDKDYNKFLQDVQEMRQGSIRQHETIGLQYAIIKRRNIVIALLALILVIVIGMSLAGCREQPTATTVPADSWMPTIGKRVYDHFTDNARTYRDTVMLASVGTKRLRYGASDWMCKVYSDNRLVYGMPIDTAHAPRLVVALPDSLDAEFVIADTISTASEKVGDKVLGYFQSLRDEPTQGVIVSRETSFMTYYITMNVGLTRVDSAGVTVQALWRYVK